MAGDEFDTRQIRQLVSQGQILSLDAILQKQRLPNSSRVLDLEVEREHGTIIYEIEILTQQGYVEEWKIDAKTGQLIRKKDEH